MGDVAPTANDLQEEFAIRYLCAIAEGRVTNTCHQERIHAEWAVEKIKELTAEIRRLQSLISEHAKEHLCLRKHGGEERPEKSGEYPVKVKRYSLPDVPVFRMVYFSTGNGWSIWGEVLEWYSMPEGGYDE